MHATPDAPDGPEADAASLDETLDQITTTVEHKQITICRLALELRQFRREMRISIAVVIVMLSWTAAGAPLPY